MPAVRVHERAADLGPLLSGTVRGALRTPCADRPPSAQQRKVAALTPAATFFLLASTAVFAGNRSDAAIDADDMRVDARLEMGGSVRKAGPAAEAHPLPGRRGERRTPEQPYAAPLLSASPR